MRVYGSEKFIVGEIRAKNLFKPKKSRLITVRKERR